MKSTLLVIVILLFACHLPALSQFSGAYAPSNWTTTLSAGSSGSVNATTAPGSIKVTGSNGGPGSNRDASYTIPLLGTGVWSCNWAYATVDAPSFDYGGILINGVFTQLSNNGGAMTQSGTYTSASLPAGTIIGFGVRSLDNDGGAATMTITSFTAPAGTLPVTFTYFTAERKGSTVEFNWATASESGSDHFNVQRSADGINFSPIGASLKAQGNSSALVKYTAKDDAPFAGVNYYRIVEVDIDGREYLTKIVPVTMDVVSRMRLYPNPAVDNVVIELDKQVPGQVVQLQLFSPSGQVIESRTINNTVTMPARINWNVSKLPPGMYFFKAGNQAISLPFIKQ